MKTRYLFPHRFKKVGWVLFVVSVVMGLLTYHQVLELRDQKLSFIALLGMENSSSDFDATTKTNAFLPSIFGALMIVGALLAACSKEKHEDEFIAKLRLESLLWATYTHYVLLALAILFVYDMPFLNVMIYGMFTTLLLFLVRFNMVLYLSGQASTHAE
ncbi:hypothetical protein [Hymenobacter koreensis]|uniref:Uncharacterized protein n=1 Tax=Hymenobacter koreensis TaxID=1084523 RepID=A0ABP8J1Y0_9BACT